jgi:PleD family two-component response regulator
MFWAYVMMVNPVNREKELSEPLLSNPSDALILVVDDSPDNLRVLSTALIQQDYEVRCVKSGSMALRSVQVTLPDLILLDIKMPEMDGYEVCQRLKSSPQTVDIPVIFLSALDEAWDKVRAFNVGGLDYITKPFQLEEVLVRVKNQLTIRQLQQQLIRQNLELEVAREATNRIKGELLAIEAPLDTILNLSDRMIQEGIFHREHLEIIHRNAQNILAAIDISLTSSTPETSLD